MGAQAAALLAGPPPYGDLPPVGPDDGGLRLPAPKRWSPTRSLDLLARSTAGVALRPSAYDGQRLHRVLAAGHAVAVRVDPALRVTWTGPAPDREAVRRQLTTVLGLDDDLTGLWDACAHLPALAWVAESGAGRVLRAPTVLEDLVGLLAATGSSLRATRARVAALVGDGPFPDPGALAAPGEDALRERGWGFRAPALAAVARAVDEGRVDPESWRALPDDELTARVTALPGFGPFSAAGLLPLLGRPRPLVLDAWLRDRLRALHPGLTDDAALATYAPLGRWAGTGLWLDVSAAWLRPRG